MTDQLDFTDYYTDALWHLSPGKLAPSGRPGKAGNKCPLSEYRDRAGRLRYCNGHRIGRGCCCRGGGVSRTKPYRQRDCGVGKEQLHSRS
jgi:hypothetical protein